MCTMYSACNGYLCHYVFSCSHVFLRNYDNTVINTTKTNCSDAKTTVYPKRRFISVAYYYNYTADITGSRLRPKDIRTNRETAKNGIIRTIDFYSLKPFVVK